MFQQLTPQLAEPSYQKEKHQKKAESYHTKSQYILFQALAGSKKYYSKIEKICYVVVMSARKIRHYFKAHRVRVLTNQPLNDIFRNWDSSGSIGKWAIELSEHVVDSEKRSAIKSQVLAYFIVGWTELSSNTEGTVVVVCDNDLE
jgi:hypothetical protein